MKFSNILIIFGLVVIGLLFLTIPRGSAMKDESTLVVGISPDYPPYAFIDFQTGKINGFDIDVMLEVARRIDKKMVIRDMSFASLIFGLLSGDVDVIASGISPTPRRAKFVSFTQPYLDSDAYVVMTLRDRFVPTSLDDLVGKNIVVNTGYTAEAYLDQQKLDISIIRLRTPAEALIALQSGSVDAFVSARNTVSEMISKIGDAGRFNLLVLPETGDGCALALRKHSTVLIEKINKALNSMRIDGTLNRLKENWKLA